LAVAGVILAAGESRRMGRPKALLRVGPCTFLEAIAGRMGAAGVERVLAVVGEDRARIQREVRCGGLEWVVNEDPSRGQLSSLQCGLDAVGEGWDVLMTLVDHPLVRRDTYEVLIEKFRENPQYIVIPTVRSRRGHPIMIGARWFAEFRAAPLEVGARWVIDGGRVPILEVPVTDPGVRRDIDTPGDYGRWVEGGAA